MTAEDTPHEEFPSFAAFRLSSQCFRKHARGTYVWEEVARVVRLPSCFCWHWNSISLDLGRFHHHLAVRDHNRRQVQQYESRQTLLSSSVSVLHFVCAFLYTRAADHAHRSSRYSRPCLTFATLQNLVPLYFCNLRQPASCVQVGLSQLHCNTGTPLETSKRRWMYPVLYTQTFNWIGQLGVVGMTFPRCYGKDIVAGLTDACMYMLLAIAQETFAQAFDLCAET